MNPLFFKVTFFLSVAGLIAGGLALAVVWVLDALTHMDGHLDWRIGLRLFAVWLVGLALVVFYGWCVYHP
jgi:hypothetical protein